MRQEPSYPSQLISHLSSKLECRTGITDIKYCDSLTKMEGRLATMNSGLVSIFHDIERTMSSLIFSGCLLYLTDSSETNLILL